MKKKGITILALLSGLMSLTPANACSRVFMNMYPGYMVSARNLDFFGPADPSLIISPRGVIRNGGSEANVAKWKSKYGSVILYADGVFPADGMNEKGLAAHTLFYTNGSQVQKNNQDKPTLESRAWVSYVLDNFSSVNEAVTALTKLRLVAVSLPIDYPSANKHMAIEDVSGDSAIIEIDNGVVNIYHDKSYRVMTNTPSYAEQLQNIAKYESSTVMDIPGGINSEARMIRASYDVNHLPAPTNKSQAQGAVLSVANAVSFTIGELPAEKEAVVKKLEIYSKYPQKNLGYGTYWNTISDLSNKEWYFKSVSSPTRIWLSLKQINFNSGQPILAIPHLDDYSKNGMEGNILKYAKPTNSLNF